MGGLFVACLTLDAVVVASVPHLETVLEPVVSRVLDVEATGTEGHKWTRV
jgi:hypothetical protein